MKEEGYALRVKKKDGQKAKEALKSMGALDESRTIGREGDFLLIPLTEESAKKIAKDSTPAPWMRGDGEPLTMPKKGSAPLPDGSKVVEATLKAKEQQESFRSLFAKRFGEKKAKGILSSYELIGDIAIIQIPKGMEKEEKEIGELLLKGEKRAKAVFKKAGGREGEFRITPLAHLAGENRTETEYTENGVRMKLDISKVYFSPRLSSERKRIMEAAKDRENVLILFAGIGPFALEIAKAHPKCKVAGIELNPEAIRYFQENIKFNKLKNAEAIQGDAKEECSLRFASWADRIAMPLPLGAEGFLEPALIAARDGCTIHFYTMLKREAGTSQAKKKISSIARRLNREVEFLFEKEVRPYSASTAQFAIDFRVLGKKSHL
jgi:tRNA (guanine37-N1)-methyltransferase